MFSLSFLLVALAQTPTPAAAAPETPAPTDAAVAQPAAPTPAPAGAQASSPTPQPTAPPASPAPTVPSPDADAAATAPDGDVALEGEEVPVEQEVPAGLVPPALRVDAPARYPEALRETRLQGEVLLILLVDDAGAVSEVAIEASPHDALSEAAVAAARQLEFAPATLDGEPVAVRIPFTYFFRAPPQVASPEVSVLHGRVRAQGTREPIRDAFLHVDVLPEPIPAEADGSFSLTLPPGAHEVCVSAISHSRRCFDEVLQADQSLEVRYALLPDVVSPYETVVRGERERVEVSSVRLRGAELREVPGTMGDPFRVVMLMPGVASIGSGLAYPVVRGTQPAATGYFIDGVRVPALFHMALGPSIVHPEFLDGINFYPGAPPARFGRLLGGVVEGRVSRPREDRVRAVASIDLINAGAYLEVPIEQTGTSITLAGRFSYTGWLLAAAASTGIAQMSPNDPGAQADFSDYQGRVEQRIGQGRLRLLAFGASDIVGTRATGPDQFTGSLRQIFHRADLRWTQPLAGGEFRAGVTAGSDVTGMFAQENRVDVGEFSANQVNLNAYTGWRHALSEQLALEVGGEFEHRRAATRVRAGPVDLLEGGDPNDVVLNPQALGNFGSLWAEAIWKPGARWTVTPGLRLDSYKLLHGGLFLAPEPRAAVRYQLSDQWTLKGGAGLFHQQPTVLIAIPVVDVAGLNFGLQQGLQFAAGAEWKGESGLELSADVYFNPIVRSVEFSLNRLMENSRRRGRPDDLSTTGQSYGFELMARHPLGNNWFGWVSYSYNRSTRVERFARYAEDGAPTEIVEGPVDFAFQQKHVLNAALSYQLPGRWTLGATFHVNTGRPESGEISSRTSRVVTDPAGDWAWMPVERDQVDALPTFWRIDARVAKDWVFENWTLQAYLDFFNVSFRNEVLGYRYTTQFVPGAGAMQPHKEPLQIPLFVPMLGVKGTY